MRCGRPLVRKFVRGVVPSRLRPGCLDLVPGQRLKPEEGSSWAPSQVQGAGCLQPLTEAGAEPQRSWPLV